MCVGGSCRIFVYFYFCSGVCFLGIRFCMFVLCVCGSHLWEGCVVLSVRVCVCFMLSIFVCGLCVSVCERDCIEV